MLLKGVALFLLICVPLLVSGKKPPTPLKISKDLEINEGRSRVIEATKICNDIQRYSMPPKEVDKYCKKQGHLMHMIPHPDDCSAYFECRSFYDEENIPPYFSSKYMRVCPYPQLYFVIDRTHGECRDPQEVEKQACGRNVPQSPCDYITYRCFKGNCPPCDVMFPSCVGEPNGNRLILGEVRSFKECHDGRTVGTRKKSCHGDEVFDPVKRTCAPGATEGQRPKKI